MKRLLTFPALFVVLLLAIAAAAQDTSQTQSSPPVGQSTGQPSSAQDKVEPMDKTPLYHVTVVERTARAVNYQHRGGATKINFRGTDLLPKANGEAKVESKQGYMEVEVEFDDIDKPASSFGPEYLTYVLWAISPQGRAENLGEVILNGNRSKLNVTTQMQAFALIVTAEPYFAVRTPSNLVVMENVIRSDTKGNAEIVNAKYELLERGEYADEMDRARLAPLVQGERKVPLELLEARNAVRIADWAQANQYAQDTYKRANDLLAQAQRAQDQKADKKTVIRFAREAVQTAEDARILSLRRREQERIANERRDAEQREAAARAQAEQQRQAAELSQQNAQLAQRNAQLEAEQRQQAEEARQQAEAATQRAVQERAAADAARQAAVQQQQQLATQTQQAQLQAQRAEQEKEQLRARLRNQLNQVLQTRDTARGLIVNMSDVLFDTGKATLRPGAREKLAKIAGILIAYPDLRLTLEGHTDSTGPLSLNERLSQERAATVRDYLVKQGIGPNSIVGVEGLGPSQPVASNATPTGRQQNRRVEIVVAGDVIGTHIAPGGDVSAQQ